MSSRQDETHLPPAEPAVADPVAEPTPEDLIAVVNQSANVRTGPSTDYGVAFWLTAGDEVVVVGRNAGRRLAADRTSGPARLDLHHFD